MKIFIFVIAIVLWAPIMGLSFIAHFLWFGLKSGWYICDGFIHWFMDDKVQGWIE